MKVNTVDLDQHQQPDIIVRGCAAVDDSISSDRTRAVCVTLHSEVQHNANRWWRIIEAPVGKLYPTFPMVLSSAV